MDILNSRELGELLSDLMDFLASDTLRNFLTSTRIIAELARAVYRLVFTAVTTATQIIDAAFIPSSSQVFPAAVSTTQTVEMSFIGPTSKVFPPGVSDS